MCLPDSIKSASRSDFVLTAEELKDYRSLQHHVPKQLYSIIKDWNEKRPFFQFKTSGSTGAPKNLNISRERILLSAQKTIKFLDLKPGITALLALKLDYIAGFMVLIRALESGMDLHFFQPTSDPFERLKNHRQYFAAFVPLQVFSLYDKKYDITNFYKVIIGGAALNRDLRLWIKELSYPVFETYGMTETVTHIALRRLNGEDYTEYFKILDQVEIKTDSESRLSIKSDVCEDQWINTNDIVELIDQDSFLLRGRHDDVINSGGIKSFPLELEEKIARIAQNILGHKNFIITSKSHEELGEAIVLAIEGDELLTFEKMKLQKVLNTLDKYLNPKEIIYLAKFPRTNSGKINRSKVKKLIS